MTLGDKNTNLAGQLADIDNLTLAGYQSVEVDGSVQNAYGTTYTINNTGHDAYICFVNGQGGGSASGFQVRVNGYSTSDYNYYSLNGSSTTGDTKFDNRSGGGNKAISGAFILEYNSTEAKILYRDVSFRLGDSLGPVDNGELNPSDDPGNITQISLGGFTTSDSGPGSFDLTVLWMDYL